MTFGDEDMKDKRIIFISGMFTALLASACCIGPVLFFAFGITGLGVLSRFEWLRPYSLILTFVFIGMAYRYAYGRGSRCEADGACNPAARRINRILFWILVGFTIFGVGFPYVSAWLLA